MMGIRDDEQLPAVVEVARAADLNALAARVAEAERAPSVDAVAMAVIRMVSDVTTIAIDPKAAQKRLDMVTAAEMRQREEEAGSKRMLAKRSQEQDARQVELDAQKADQATREAELVAVEARWRQRNAAVEAREYAVSEEGILAECRQIKREVDAKENWYASQLGMLSGLSSRYQGILQPRRTLPQLVEEIRHDLRSAEPDPAFEGPADGEREQVPVENLVSGTSLARSITRRGADRRA